MQPAASDTPSGGRGAASAERRGTCPGLPQDVPVSDLADSVLPLIRTRTDLHRRSAANAHGRQMHEAVDILEAACGLDATGTFAVTRRAIAAGRRLQRHHR